MTLLQSSSNARGRCNCCFQASTMLLLQRSWTLQLLLPCFCNAPATLLDTDASWPLQRFCKAPRRCNRCNRYFLVSATLLQKSCKAPGRCNCCFQASAKLLQRSWTLQLLLPGLCNAPAVLLLRSQKLLLVGLCNAPGRHNCCSRYFLVSATLLQRSWKLQLLLPVMQRSQKLQLLCPGLCNAPAILLKTAASWPLQCSCHAPGWCSRCKRHFLVLATLQERSCNALATLQLLLPGRCNASATLSDAATAASCFCEAPATLLDTAASWLLQCSCNAPGRCDYCSVAFATLLQSYWTLLLPGLCDVPVVLLDGATKATATFQSL